MEIENLFHIENELLRTLDVETEPENVVICNLVQKAQDLNYIDFSDGSALHISAKRNFLNSARILLEAGASPNVKGSTLLNYQTPLHICSALQNGIEMVRLLLRHGADVNANDEVERTPLHICSGLQNDLEMVRLLLRHGADVNAKDEDERAPLHICSGLQNGLEMVRLLLTHGADMNAKDEYERTPLHIASYNDCVENVQELLNCGADVNAVSPFYKTPLISALTYKIHGYHEKKNFQIVQALLRAGADVNYNSEYGETALHYAAMRCFPDIIRLLLKNKAEVNAKNRWGRTPLHLAVKECSRQSFETIRELMQGGAIVNALDLYERSAMYDAIIFCNIEAVQELLRCGVHFKFEFFIKALETLDEKFFNRRIKNMTVFCKEFIRYVFFNSPNSLESIRQKLVEGERGVCLLNKLSTPKCNLVDFTNDCATEADTLSKMICDCGQSNIWATFLGHQDCGCDRNGAILKFLFSGQLSNFDYCFFYKLSKSFLLEVTLNQMSFIEFRESGKRVLLNWPCMKEMERYVSFEDVAAFIQNQRSVMGASVLEDVFTFSTGKSTTESSSEIKHSSPKKMRVS